MKSKVAEYIIYLYIFKKCMLKMLYNVLIEFVKVRS
jgi:hypothetical protein